MNGIYSPMMPIREFRLYRSRLSRLDYVNSQEASCLFRARRAEEAAELAESLIAYSPTNHEELRQRAKLWRKRAVNVRINSLLIQEGM